MNTWISVYDALTELRARAEEHERRRLGMPARPARPGPMLITARQFPRQRDGPCQRPLIRSRAIGTRPEEAQARRGFRPRAREHEGSRRGGSVAKSVTLPLSARQLAKCRDRPRQTAVDTNRGDRSASGRSPGAERLRLAIEVESGRCRVDGCPRFQMKRRHGGLLSVSQALTVSMPTGTCKPPGSVRDCKRRIRDSGFRLLARSTLKV
jgi:hypothetical protein